jgi:hypothetical protein
MGTAARDLRELPIPELARLARAATLELARRSEPAAFSALLDLQQQLGVSLGESARTLAAQGSWSGVAELSGTTKQAAWSRWSG